LWIGSRSELKDITEVLDDDRNKDELVDEAVSDDEDLTMPSFFSFFFDFSFCLSRWKRKRSEIEFNRVPRWKSRFDLQVKLTLSFGGIFGSLRLQRLELELWFIFSHLNRNMFYYLLQTG
jgi:hypothetical protein